MLILVFVVSVSLHVVFYVEDVTAEDVTAEEGNLSSYLYRVVSGWMGMITCN